MTNRKRILLTGATGFLGSHLLRNYLANGHQVTILKRSFSNTTRIAPYLSHVHSIDLDMETMDKAFEADGPFDCVVHTATSYGRRGETASEVFETNLVFPLHLLQTAMHYKTPIFFNTATVLDSMMNYYALSKKQFEDWGRMFAAQGAVQFVNIKLEHMFGPGDDSSKFTTFIIESLKKNVPQIELTPGEQKRDFIFIEDTVAAYDLLLNRMDGQAGFEEFDLGSGQAVSIRGFVERVKQLTHSTTELMFGEKNYRDNEVMCSQADITRLKHLGWYPQYSLDQGIQETISKEGQR